MTTTYVSMATARRAEEVQHRHRADKDGWCAHHLRHFHVRVRAGECDPWLIAQEIIVAYDQQQTRTLPESPVVGQTVPGRDLTHPGPPPVGRGGPHLLGASEGHGLAPSGSFPPPVAAAKWGAAALKPQDGQSTYPM